MKKLFRDFVTLFKEAHTQKYHKHDESAKCISAIIGAILLFAIAIINLYVGIRDDSVEGYINFGSLLALTIVLIVCAYVVEKRKNYLFYNITMSISIVIVFTYYCIQGTCKGIGMVWLLIVPVFAITMIDIAIGTALSIYFLILGCVMFYGFHSYFSAFYTEEFMVRYVYIMIADIVVSLLVGIENYVYSYQLERRAYIDGLTNLGNRHLYDEKIVDYVKKGYDKDLCVLLFDINGLKQANDMIGHHAGDELIITTATLIERCFKDVGLIICRRGGDEFYVLARTSKEQLEECIKNFNELTNKWVGDFCPSLSISLGYARWEEYPNKSLNALEIIADNFMYESKRKYYVSNKRYRELYEENDDQD